MSETWWRDLGDGRCERRVGYFCVKRKIRKGEEILCLYGKGFAFGPEPAAPAADEQAGTKEKGEGG